MSEELIYSGLFSGLAAKDELNRLLEELYGEGFEQAAALQGMLEQRILRALPHYSSWVPDVFEEFMKQATELKEEASTDGGIELERVLEPAAVS